MQYDFKGLVDTYGVKAPLVLVKADYNALHVCRLRERSKETFYVKRTGFEEFTLYRVNEKLQKPVSAEDVGDEHAILQCKTIRPILAALGFIKP